MKVSTKGRYGLRLMIDLAIFYDVKLVSLKDISKKENISGKYLEQIIMQLHRGNLVKGVRGAQGGYALSREPQQITVGDVLRVVEGSMSPVDCLDKNDACERRQHCTTLEVWEKLKNAIDGVIDNITLKDLADKEIEKQTEFTYII
ncbi:MAG: Rrf2 family transcriptional regulator [Oscillospiraceae bacterium]